MSERTFRAGLRSAVRGLWSEAIDEGQFVDAMQSTIRRNLTVAWNEGAADCGIAPDELSEAEIEARDEFIDNQFSYLSGFGEAIAEDGDNRLRDLYSRVELWVNRYGEARNQAKVLACKDSKLEWRIGVKGCKEHCPDCLGYNGKVYRASTWAKYDIRPQHRGLNCKGFRCCCGFVVTTKSANKGKPPAMRG